jgi:hypothetical protein
VAKEDGMRLLLWQILLSSVLLGCAQQPRQSHADGIAQIPSPQDDNDRQRKCAWIRSEIARQQGMGAAVASMQTNQMMAIAVRSQAQQNIANLESRASDFGCYAAFSNRPAVDAAAPQAQSRSTIESCVAACKANTSRTPEQCFDSCNH